MEPTVSSETSAIRNQTPGNYPKKEQITLLFFSLKNNIFPFGHTALHDATSVTDKNRQ